MRLLDFGLAQFDGADTLTAVGDVPGTLAYIAPERLAGDDASPESDVWSVGVLLWETLSGRHPFWGVPIQEVAGAIEAGAPPLATRAHGLPDGWSQPWMPRSPSTPPAGRRAADLAAELRNALRATDRPAAKARETQRTSPRSHPRGATPAASSPSRSQSSRRCSARRCCRSGHLCSSSRSSPLPGSRRWLDPRAGLAVALAAPVFPIGNVAASAAMLYGALAIGWLLLTWRDARHGLLFVAGPLLAAVGLLPLVPLVVQPARGGLRRAAHGAVAVFSAALLAGLAGEPLPVAGERAARSESGR